MQRHLVLAFLSVATTFATAETIVTNIDADLFGGTTDIYSDPGALLGRCGPRSAHNAVISPQGGLLVGDHFGGLVYKQRAVGFGGSAFCGPGTFRGAAGMVYDRNGNLYLADYGSDRIFKVDPSGTMSLFVASVAGPDHMVVHHGNLWVACAKNNFVRRFDLSDPDHFVDYPTGLDFPVGLDFDSRDNFYVSSYSQGIVRKINIDTFAVTDVVTGLIQPHGVTVGPDSLLYVVESGRNRVLRVGLDGGAYSEFLTGLRSPIDIKFGALKKFVYLATQRPAR